MTGIAKLNLDIDWTTALAASTDLDTKTTTTAIAAGAVIDNVAQKALWLGLSLILGSVNPTGSPYWEVHLLELVQDITNYADRTAGSRVGSIIVSTGSSIKYPPPLWVPIRYNKFKIQLVNQMGVSTAGSGNSFQYRLSNFNLNG